MNRMDRMKDFYNDFSTEFKTTMLKVMNGDTSAFSKGDRVSAVVGAACGVMIASSSAVFADDVIDNAGGTLQKLYPRLAGIATLVAACCILIALLWTMVSPGQHSSGVPIGWIKKIIICWIAILAFGGVVTFIENLTSGQGWNATYKKSGK